MPLTINYTSILVYSFLIAQKPAKRSLFSHRWYSKAEGCNPSALIMAGSVPIYWDSLKMPVYFVSGKALSKVNCDGTGFTYIFEPGEVIREYHFSPDGKMILVLTENRLYLIDQNGKTKEEIDSLGELVFQKQARGSFHSIKWAEDGTKFCYAVYQWSAVSLRESYYIYDLANHDKRIITAPIQNVSEFFWDQNGDYLYYARSNTVEYKEPRSYHVAVYRISVDKLKSELVLRDWFGSPNLGDLDLKDKGIQLFNPHPDLSFSKKNSIDLVAVSDKGAKILLDKKK